MLPWRAASAVPDADRAQLGRRSFPAAAAAFVPFPAYIEIRESTMEPFCLKKDLGILLFYNNQIFVVLFL